jgi:hypothetical protein
MAEALIDDDDFDGTARMPIVIETTPDGSEVWTLSLGRRVLAELERHAHRNGFGNGDPLSRLLALADMLIEHSSTARADRLN